MLHLCWFQLEQPHASLLLFLLKPLTILIDQVSFNGRYIPCQLGNDARDLHQIHLINHYLHCPPEALDQM